jgi:hypothetical protein
MALMKMILKGSKPLIAMGAPDILMDQARVI